MSLLQPQPTDQKARIAELDIFRGFAIFGIFMVNILVMNVCFAFREQWELEQTGWLSLIALTFLQTFFFSKFFAIFSFLFGIGVALQIQRVKEKLAYHRSFFLRRFVSLFLMGVAHILFLWSGDILHLYGVLGLLLLIFFRLPARGLLWSSIIVFMFPFYGSVYDQIVTWLEAEPSLAMLDLTRQRIAMLKIEGTYTSGISLRLKEWQVASNLIYAGITPIAFAMMLLGGYVVKKGWLSKLDEVARKVAWPLVIAVVILIAYRFLLINWILPTFEIVHGSAISITFWTLFQLSDVALSLFYLWLIIVALRSSFLRKILSPLRHVGRAALSNYILQSVIGYLVMRTFGFYEEFSPAECIAFVVTVFIVQIFISRSWLKHFLFGPLEWVWRCISYWKVLPIKRTKEN